MAQPPYPKHVHNRTTHDRAKICGPIIEFTPPRIEQRYMCKLMTKLTLPTTEKKTCVTYDRVALPVTGQENMLPIEPSRL